MPLAWARSSMRTSSKPTVRRSAPAISFRAMSSGTVRMAVRSCDRAGRSDRDRELLPPAGVDALGELGLGVVDRPLGDAGQDRLEGDAGLDLGQVGAQAEVGAEAEGHQLTRLAVDVEDL